MLSHKPFPSDNAVHLKHQCYRFSENDNLLTPGDISIDDASIDARVLTFAGRSFSCKNSTIKALMIYTPPHDHTVLNDCVIDASVRTGQHWCHGVFQPEHPLYPWCTTMALLYDDYGV